MLVKTWSLNDFYVSIDDDDDGEKCRTTDVTHIVPIIKFKWKQSLFLLVKLLLVCKKPIMQEQKPFTKQSFFLVSINWLPISAMRLFFDYISSLIY